MKRIVISGGTGLIGQSFIKQTLVNGYEVVVLTRRASLTGLPSGVIPAQWDGRTEGEWQKWLEESTAVVNLAGENLGAGLWTKQRKQRILDSRVAAGRVLARAVANTARKPKVFLQASAIGYYGATGEQPVTEASPAGKDFLASICLDWEGSTRGVENSGVRWVTLRTGIVLDRKAGALARVALPIQLFCGGPLGNGKQYWSWISLEDEVGAMHYLLEKEDAAGSYNLTAPNPVAMAEFGRSLASVLKRPFWLPVPAFALRLLLGEMSAVVLDSQRILPERLLQAGYVFKYREIKPALENIYR